jgi:hypothetical protein
LTDLSCVAALTAKAATTPASRGKAFRNVETLLFEPELDRVSIMGISCSLLEAQRPD